MKIKEHNVAENKVFEREATEVEIQDILYREANSAQEQEALSEIAEQKSLLLQKLGITEEEAKLLLS
jgi:hypothetical protein